jgi:hypothetical protein
MEDRIRRGKSFTRKLMRQEMFRIFAHMPDDPSIPQFQSIYEARIRPNEVMCLNKIMGKTHAHIDEWYDMSLIWTNFETFNGFGTRSRWWRGI